MLCLDPLGIAGLALGGAGLLSGLFGSKEQSRNVRDTNSMNLQIARETNQTQKELAVQNQRNQLALMRENNEWSAKQAEHMFNLENEYNDPAAQRERLSNAGFNPAVAMSNGAVGASMGDIATPSAAGTTFSPSLPNFVTPTMQAPPSVMLGMQDAIANLANGFSTYQSARKTEKEISRYDENLDAQIRQLSSQAALADSQKQYQDVLSRLENTFGHGERMRKIARDFREIYLLGLQGETEKATRELTEWNAKIAKQTHGRNEQEIPFIIAAAEQSVNLIKEKQRTEQSQQSSNYASAEASKASAELSRKQARINELESDAKEIFNEFLPEQIIQDMSMKDLDIIDKIYSSGRANNIPNLVDKLINSGVRKAIAKEVADAMDRRKKYLERFHKYSK